MNLIKELVSITLISIIIVISIITIKDIIKYNKFKDNEKETKSN